MRLVEDDKRSTTPKSEDVIGISTVCRLQPHHEDSALHGLPVRLHAGIGAVDVQRPVAVQAPGRTEFLIGLIAKFTRVGEPDNEAFIVAKQVVAGNSGRWLGLARARRHVEQSGITGPFRIKEELLKFEQRSPLMRKELAGRRNFGNRCRVLFVHNLHDLAEIAFELRIVDLEIVEKRAESLNRLVLERLADFLPNIPGPRPLPEIAQKCRGFVLPEALNDDIAHLRIEEDIRGRKGLEQPLDQPVGSGCRLNRLEILRRVVGKKGVLRYDANNVLEIIHAFRSRCCRR